MTRQEKKKYIAELKKRFEDHQEIIDKKERDLFIVNLGKIDVPDVDNRLGYIKLVYDDNQDPYLGYVVNLGLNPKVKERRKEERKAKSDKLRREKKKL